MTRAYNTATTQQNSGGAVNPFVAGKNRIINGDFNIWQRGTSFSNPAAGTFIADRYYVDYNGTGGTTTISQQTTPTVIATGVNTSSFLRWSNTVAGTGQGYNVISQKIENVATFAEQTVTFSFYAKASASTALSQIFLHQNFGSGGSSEIYYNLGSATITTSWARYSFTVALGSLSGKTIGAGSFLRAFIGAPLNSTFTIDTWGWQVEAGSVATPFQTATGTIQGELAACQRYYYRSGGAAGGGGYAGTGSGVALSTTSIRAWHALPVIMRSAISISRGGNMTFWPSGLLSTAIGGGYSSQIANGVMIDWTVSAATADRAYVLYFENSANNFLEFSAEL